MRILVGLLAVIATVAVTPQSSSDFHARYGEPSAERFAVRPDMTLTVEYGEDGQACAMRLEPRHLFRRDSSIDPPPATMGAITEVLDELVSPETRGKELGAGEKIWGECNGATPPMEYENVSINPYYGICERPPKVRGVDVHFKRSACEAFQPRRVPAARK